MTNGLFPFLEYDHYDIYFVPWAALIKFHKLDDLNKRHLIDTSRGEKSKIKLLADLISGYSPVPVLKMTKFSLYPHTAEKERSLWSFLLRALIPYEDLTLMTSTIFIYHKGPISKYYHTGARAST